jgi:hypothetical protein
MLNKYLSDGRTDRQHRMNTALWLWKEQKEEEVEIRQNCLEFPISVACAFSTTFHLSFGFAYIQKCDFH